MRAVIDTNVLLSGLLWRGQPHALLEHVRSGTLAMVSSPALLAELADVPLFPAARFRNQRRCVGRTPAIRFLHP